MQTDFRWEDCQHILCIRTDGPGGVLKTTPAFRALKEALPGRRLTLLTSAAGAGIARYIPEIDNIIIFDPPWESAEAGNREVINRMANTLRKRRFGAAVLFSDADQNVLPMTMLTYMAGIPRIAGYCRENPQQLITDWVQNPPKHEVERSLHLVRALGCAIHQPRMSLSVPPEAGLQALEMLAEAGVSPHQPWLVLHIQSPKNRCRFEESTYVKMAWGLIHELGYQVVLTGDAADRPAIEELCESIGSGAWNLAGALSPEIFCALISQANVFISSDSYAMQMAAAVETPVVMLTSGSDADRRSPWQVPNRVVDVGQTDSLTSAVVRAVDELVEVDSHVI